MSKKINKEERVSFFKKMKHMKIARKITVYYGGLFSLSLIIISIFMTLNISAIQQHATRKSLNNTISQIKKYLEEEGELSDDTLATLGNDRYVETVVLDKKTGKLYFSHSADAPSFINWTKNQLGDRKGPEKEQLMPDGQEKHPSFEEENPPEGYHINMRRETSTDSIEYILEDVQQQKVMLVSTNFTAKGIDYRVETFKMIDHNSSFMRGFIVKLIMVDLLGVLCAFLVGRYISRRMLQPVEAIRVAAERISIEDLSRRIEIDGPDDEMKELSVTFNSMIDRLETAFQRQNEFVSDASHELRTPIAVIQGYAHLINRWGKSDPDVLQESIDSIISETTHMSGLIGKLLLLAKSDQNRVTVIKERRSLDELATEVMKEFELLEYGCQLVYEKEDGVEIWADAGLVKQLMWVHMENAVKYSPQGGTITLRVWKDKTRAYVSVQDTGIGIQTEDLPFIFDRFYRVDKSRNKEISGTGLGLPIAQWIMSSHEGEILVESSEEAGTTFTDCFPLFRSAFEQKKNSN